MYNSLRPPTVANVDVVSGICHSAIPTDDRFPPNVEFVTDKPGDLFEVELSLGSLVETKTEFLDIINRELPNDFRHCAGVGGVPVVLEPPFAEIAAVNVALCVDFPEEILDVEIELDSANVLFGDCLFHIQFVCVSFKNYIYLPFTAG